MDRRRVSVAICIIMNTANYDLLSQDFLKTQNRHGTVYARHIRQTPLVGSNRRDVHT